MNFVHNDSLTFPRLTQHNLPSGRAYRAEDGEFKGHILPSITRILAKKEKPQLDAWKKRVGAMEAARVSARATVQGSALHKLMEVFLNNEELPKFSPNVGELWQYLKTWLITHVEVIYGQENDVASFMLGGAGRFDLLCRLYGGDLVVVDLKSASRPKRAEWIEDYFVQGTFYALAVYECTKAVVKRIIFPIVSPEGLQVFESTPAKHYKELRIRINDFYSTYDQVPLDAATPAVV